MTVQELIDALLEYDPTRIVVMSKDGKGNRFSPLSGMGPHVYVPDTTWSGDIYLESLDDVTIGAGYTEDDVYHGEDGQPAVVLWPVN